jgi:hypothetical protein
MYSRRLREVLFTCSGALGRASVKVRRSNLRVSESILILSLTLDHAPSRIYQDNIRLNHAVKRHLELSVDADLQGDLLFGVVVVLDGRCFKLRRGTSDVATRDLYNQSLVATTEFSSKSPMPSG